MNTRHYLLPLATLLILSGCDQLQSSRDADSADDDSSTTPAMAITEGVVLATVNGSPISQGALDVYSAQRKSQGAGKDVSDTAAILDELIALELMRQEANNKGLGSSAVVVATIDQQQRTVLAGAAIKDFMTNNPVTDEEAQTLYEAQTGKAGKEYNARHILVENEEDATAVIELLDKGSDFSELAKEKSTWPSGPTGGKLGWFGAGQMVKPFSDAAAELEKGSYTKTPVQTQFGWHVIILDDVRESTPPPFDDVKERLKMMIANQKLQAHVESMKSSATIDIKVQ
ncbi:MAG: peptidylprolyl isomerase [Gammaproteobacteria bacterium]|nr:peptidylprolyl isomerase [Gammaproteobacteria bacterium]